MHPNKALVPAALLILAGALAAQPRSSPFPMNGWQLHDYNMPKLEEAVRRAPSYGVNFLILL